MTRFQTLLAGAALALASLTTQAASVGYTFTGLTDDLQPYPLAPFSGRFHFDAIGEHFSGDASLSDFSLEFQGQSYDLADADAPALARFEDGVFLGVDFADFDAAGRAGVGLTAGFFDLGEAFFSYGSAAGVEGYGSLQFEREVAVPLPGSMGLALGALLGLRLVRRKSGR